MSHAAEDEEHEESATRACVWSRYPVALAVVNGGTAVVARPRDCRSAKLRGDTGDPEWRQEPERRFRRRSPACWWRVRRGAALWLAAVALGMSTGVTATDSAASAAVTSGAPATSRVVGTSGSGSGWRGSWPPPGPKPHDPCTGAFQGSPQGSVQETTSAGPNGSSVMPGQRITVTLTWKPSDFSGNQAFLSEDCVEIGSRPAVALSQVHFPAPSGGTDTLSYVVPRGGTGGQPICDRGVVAGNFDLQQGSGLGKGPGKKGGWHQDGGSFQGDARTSSKGARDKVRPGTGDRDGSGQRKAPSSATRSLPPMRPRRRTRSSSRWRPCSSSGARC